MATAEKARQGGPQRATVSFDGLGSGSDSSGGKGKTLDLDVIGRVSAESGFPEVKTVPPKKAAKAPAKPAPERKKSTNAEKPKPAPAAAPPADANRRRPGRPRSRVTRTEQISPRLQLATYEAFGWFWDYEGWSQAEVIEAGLEALCEKRRADGEDYPEGVLDE